MNTLLPIYLSYTDTLGIEPFFQTLDGKGSLELISVSANVTGCIATVLHTRGRGDDAPIEVVCITDKGLSPEVADAISQSAIEYVMDSGLTR